MTRSNSLHEIPDPVRDVRGRMTVSPGSTISAAFRRPGRLRREDCSIDDFRASVQARTTDLADYPHAAAVERGVLLYDGDLAVKVRDPQTRPEVQTETSAR